ncbi:MAG: HAMP domain-containing histidine kinase [Lachnospiraceae bacterium]|nr:HAMP domain-containing histidine kinase [Lachnospiraceae bacterium]
MKKIMSNLLRYVLVFVAMVSGCVCAASIVVMVIASSMGMYNNELNEVTRNGRKNLAGLYSRYIFEKMAGQDDPGCMENSNLQYAIIKGVNPNEDISSKANTEVINNDRNIVYTTLGTYPSLPDEFYYKNCKFFDRNEKIKNQPVSLFNSLFDDGGDAVIHDNINIVEEYVERIFYMDGIFYLETGNYAFPAYSIGIPAASLSNGNYKMLKNQGHISDKNDYVIYELVTGKDGKLFYRCPWMYNIIPDTSKYSSWSGVLINDVSFNPEAIQTGSPGKDIKLFNWEEENQYFLYVEEDPGAYMDMPDGIMKLDYLDIAISYEIKDNTYKDIYAVLSNVTTPLDKEADDLFYSQKRLIKFLYNIRYTMAAAAAISAAIFIVVLIFCCYSRYTCGDKEKVINNVFHNIPFLIYTAVIVLLLVLDINIGLDLLRKSLQYATELKMLFLICVFAGIWFMSCIFLFIMFCLETSCRLGAGIFLKSTLLYFFYNILNKAVIPLRDVYNKAERNTSLFIKTSFLLFVFNVLLLSGFILNGFKGYIIFFIVIAACAILDYIILKAVMQMEALQLHARRMAEGNLESKVDTSKMAWEFKKHGDYLNQIGEGMASAVEEKIKSERFKTELVTNVSHDIKTPLTSIINYTGLLKKEDVKPQEAKEYIEVLERQSARLKKLIEDLMEVSKTSTGNVTLEMELCDVNILLTQTLGEFEEKLDSRNLVLVINKSVESIFIMADNRHIWRIFDNLMNNICKYGQPGTRVYINIEATDKNAVIIFRNTSNYQLNISSSELMERFVRGDASRHTEGSGLGLSIARNLAGIMGGSLELHVDGDLFKVVLEFPRTVPETE